MSDTITIDYRCDMLIDQNRYIGEDPVGHACYNKADYEDQDGYLICQECVNMRETQPGRISRSVFAFGKEYQKKMIDSVVAGLK